MSRRTPSKGRACERNHNSRRKKAGCAPGGARYPKPGGYATGLFSRSTACRYPFGSDIPGRSVSIEQELRGELQDALRARDRSRLDVIRQIETEVAHARSEPGFAGEVDDALYRQVIGAYIKRMDKARHEYVAAGERGKPLADKLGFEIHYLDRWLPSRLGEEETRRLVAEALVEVGASAPGEAGRVVGHIMRTHGDEVDGALVNRLVREALGGTWRGGRTPARSATAPCSPRPGRRRSRTRTGLSS